MSILRLGRRVYPFVPRIITPRLMSDDGALVPHVVSPFVPDIISPRLMSDDASVSDVIRSQFLPTHVLYDMQLTFSGSLGHLTGRKIRADLIDRYITIHGLFLIDGLTMHKVKALKGAEIPGKENILRKALERRGLIEFLEHAMPEIFSHEDAKYWYSQYRAHGQIEGFQEDPVRYFQAIMDIYNSKYEGLCRFSNWLSVRDHSLLDEILDEMKTQFGDHAILRVVPVGGDLVGKGVSLVINYDRMVKQSLPSYEGLNPRILLPRANYGV